MKKWLEKVKDWLKVVAKPVLSQKLKDKLDKL